MERGDFAHLERQVSAFAFCDTPADLEDSVKCDGWWLGLSWLSVAKAFHVQCRLFVENGWRVPRVFKCLLVESAMRCHEVGVPLPRTLIELHDAIFGQSRGLQRLQRKLAAGCPRLVCMVCKSHVAGDVYRVRMRVGEEPAPLAHIFCKTCWVSK